MTTYVYPREYTRGKLCPIGRLDHVMFRGDKPDVSYYCPSTGDPLSPASYQLALDNASKKVYPATDHAPFSITIDGVKLLYVSLDNSARANMNGHPLALSDRLANICNIVSKVDPDIVFFSEACGKSFRDDLEPKYWLEIREIIVAMTGMMFLCECANNFDFNCLSFGVAAFTKSLSHVEIAQAYQLLPKDEERQCHGSGSVVVRLKSGTIIVAVHLPLDLVRCGRENNTARGMASLIQLLDECETAYAMGDMNTITGVISDAVAEVLESSEWKLTDDCYTFFPSYYGYLPEGAEFTEMYTLPLQ